MRQLHESSDIEDLLAVSEGRKIGHYFISHLDTPVIVFETVDDDALSDEDILFTERLLTAQFEEPYVYDGVLDPSVALQKALAMQRENEEAYRESSLEVVAHTG